MKPTFKQFLTELFEQPYQWQWKKAEAGEHYRALFQTENETPIEVNFSKIPVAKDMRREEDPRIGWVFIFGMARDTFADYDSEIGEHNASKILATVVDVVKSFVEQEQPQIIMFSGTKGQGGQLARASVYKKMVDRELPPQYEVITAEGENDTEFVIRKNQ